MKCFKDNAGRNWTVSVNVATVKPSAKSEREPDWVDGSAGA